MKCKNRSFKGDFHRILQLMKDKKSFAFNRFSDGELFIFQNKELILGDNLIKIGETSRPGPYQKVDFKHFDPNSHQFYRDRLVDAFKHKQPHYYKGLSCRCCVGDQNFQWQLEFIEADSEDNDLTWANLLLNGNYNLCINELFPLFHTYPMVVICNESASLDALPSLVKDFRVGYNAMINDYHVIEDIKQWIHQHRATGHLFLFSASSFSKMAIHQLFEEFPDNTFIDIGTTLNPFINMNFDRQYLGDFWDEKSSPSDIFKDCTW